MTTQLNKDLIDIRAKLNSIIDATTDSKTSHDLSMLASELLELNPLADIEAFKAGTQAGIDALHATIAELKEQLARKDGPGSPAVRFDGLMSELRVRFPEVSQFLSDPPEPKFLALIDKLLAK
jgi:hypothetical protein